MNFGKKSTAILLCIVMIVIAVFAGGRIGLMRLRNAAVELFETGDPESEIDWGIKYELSLRIGFATDLIVVAGRYLDEDDRFIKNVEDACETLQKATEPNKLYKANEALTAACDALHSRLSSMSLSESDARYNRNIKTDMDSCNQVMGHSEYNEKAESFNELLDDFPTSVIRVICGVKKLILFAY